MRFEEFKQLTRLLRRVNESSTRERRLRKCQEEIAELNLALHHYQDGRDNLRNVYEELADALLMILCVIFELGCVKEVLTWLRYKAGELGKRIDKGEAL